MNTTYEPVSAFTWLDYSDAERRSMQHVIGLFREKDTRDELGLGSVRDALSDLLLPGTSTIQTRARYFLFVPWIFQHLAAGHGPSQGNLEKKRREVETSLMTALDRGGVAAREGLIGRRTRERTKRLPSSIYWQGLAMWGIRRWDGSIESLLRRGRTQGLDRQKTSDDGDYVASDTSIWHPELPPRPSNLFDTTNFQLSQHEAAFLRDCIVHTVPDSMLAWLVSQGRPSDVAYLWQHPQIDDFMPQHRDQLVLAERFSTLMFGASLLYGRLLTQRHPDPARMEPLNQEWQRWFERAQPMATGWDSGAFWSVVYRVNPRISPLTRTFVEAWISQLCRAQQPHELDTPAVHQLIVQRELQLKRQLARLTHEQAYALWARSVAEGWIPQQLDFRWRTAQTLLRDMLTALEHTDAEAG